MPGNNDSIPVWDAMHDLTLGFRSKIVARLFDQEEPRLIRNEYIDGERRIGVVFVGGAMTIDPDSGVPKLLDALSEYCYDPDIPENATMQDFLDANPAIVKAYPELKNAALWEPFTQEDQARVSNYNNQDRQELREHSEEPMQRRHALKLINTRNEKAARALSSFSEEREDFYVEQAFFYLGQDNKDNDRRENFYQTLKDHDVITDIGRLDVPAFAEAMQEVVENTKGETITNLQVYAHIVNDYTLGQALEQLYEEKTSLDYNQAAKNQLRDDYFFAFLGTKNPKDPSANKEHNKPHGERHIAVDNERAFGMDEAPLFLEIKETIVNMKGDDPFTQLAEQHPNVRFADLYIMGRPTNVMDAAIQLSYAENAASSAKHDHPLPYAITPAHLPIPYLQARELEHQLEGKKLSELTTAELSYLNKANGFKSGNMNDNEVSAATEEALALIPEKVRTKIKEDTTQYVQIKAFFTTNDIIDGTLTYRKCDLDDPGTRKAYETVAKAVHAMKSYTEGTEFDTRYRDTVENHHRHDRDLHQTAFLVMYYYAETGQLSAKTKKAFERWYDEIEPNFKAPSIDDAYTYLLDMHCPRDSNLTPAQVQALAAGKRLPEKAEEPDAPKKTQPSRPPAPARSSAEEAQTQQHDAKAERKAYVEKIEYDPNVAKVREQIGADGIAGNVLLKTAEGKNLGLLAESQIEDAAAVLGAARLARLVEGKASARDAQMLKKYDEVQLGRWDNNLEAYAKNLRYDAELLSEQNGGAITKGDYAITATAVTNKAEEQAAAARAKQEAELELIATLKQQAQTTYKFAGEQMTEAQDVFDEILALYNTQSTSQTQQLLEDATKAFTAARDAFERMEPLNSQIQDATAEEAATGAFNALFSERQTIESSMRQMNDYAAQAETIQQALEEALAKEQTESRSPAPEGFTFNGVSLDGELTKEQIRALKEQMKEGTIDRDMFRALKALVKMSAAWEEAAEDRDIDADEQRELSRLGKDLAEKWANVEGKEEVTAALTAVNGSEAIAKRSL